MATPYHPNPQRSWKRKAIKVGVRNTMKSISSIPILIFVLPLFVVPCVAQSFDFYYFVQQWPGSYCDTNQGCCYPKTGKPATDFSIHGLWPYSNLGSSLLNCDPNSRFDPTKISNLTSIMQRHWPSLTCPSSDGMILWSHEWKKYGTCAKSVLDQHGYFKAALDLKKKVNLLQILRDAGIEPNGSFYSLNDVSEAIRKAVGYMAGIECNVDKSSNSQLYLIYLCTNTSGSKIIDCPGLPMGSCKSTIKFPSF